LKTLNPNDFLFVKNVMFYTCTVLGVDVFQLFSVHGTIYDT